MLAASRGPRGAVYVPARLRLVDPDRLDRVLGAWLHTGAVRVGGRMVIAVDDAGRPAAGGRDARA